MPDATIDYLPGGKPAAVSSMGWLPSSTSSMEGAGESAPKTGGFTDFLGNGGSDLIGLGASGLFGLFADNPAKDEATGMRGDLQQLAKSLSGTGDKLTTTGMDSLMPVIKYLNNLLSGNPADTLAATQPQRSMVLDQYDTAFRTIERTAPRGGGQVSTLGELEGKKASALSTITAEARTNAATQAAQLGASLTGQGVAAKAYAGNEIAIALQGAQREAEQQRQTNADAGSSIGSALATGLELAMMFI